MNRPSENNLTPWYRQFWPWFVFGLPATAVVAGITTVFIAFNNADALVNDNYYKDGLAINLQLAQDDKATALDLSADIDVDTISGEVFVTLHGNLNPPDAMRLLLLHPVDETRDSQFSLTHIANGKYRADLENIPNQRYYLRLQSTDKDWRLNGEINFAKQHKISLKHNE